MAFGRLTTKWRIFHFNLDFSLSKVAIIIQAAAKCHSFVVINNDNLLIFSKDSKDIVDIGNEV